MAEKNNPSPTTSEQTDISKAQSEQQPTEHDKRQPEIGERREQFEANEKGETLAEQRSDIEVEPIGSKETDEADSGFVGAQGEQDTSSELVEDEQEDETRSDGE